jgi:hypothetical protein
MVEHTKNDAAISNHIDKDIKAVLPDKVGAEIVESVDPLYPDDPTVPPEHLSAVGPNKPNEVIPETNLQYAPWGGQACNPYNTARVLRNLRFDNPSGLLFRFPCFNAKGPWWLGVLVSVYISKRF